MSILISSSHHPAYPIYKADDKDGQKTPDKSIQTPQKNPPPPAPPDPYVVRFVHARLVAPPAGRSGVSATEATRLLHGYVDSANRPTDLDNAAAMADLQGLSLRGMPPDARKFEQQVTAMLQKLNALPRELGNEFPGKLADIIARYETATSPEERRKFAHLADMVHRRILDPAYQTVMNDPVQRARLQFSPPFNVACLRNEGVERARLLAALGQRFDDAKTPGERERLFKLASGIRSTLQRQIAGALVSARTQTDAQWKEADQELDQALQAAKDLRIFGGGGEHSEAFARLQAFAEKAFTSPRNAQQFLYRMQNDPKSFQALKDWYADAASKSDWARRQLPNFAAMSYWDYMLRPGVKPPEPPQDFTAMKPDGLQMAHFGENLLYGYQRAYVNLSDNLKMYHAVEQGGPIEKEFVDKYMPPKPLGLRRFQEGLGLFLLNAIPGVNTFAGVLEPAPSLTSDEKFGISLSGGVFGGMLGGTKPGEFPPLEMLGDTSPEISLGKGKKGGGKVPPPEPGTREGYEGGGKNWVPDTYQAKRGSDLHPDPATPGISRDNTGHAFIKQGDKTYEVIYDKDNGTWRVTSPEGKIKPSFPVSRKSDGTWELNHDVGLPGGQPPTYSDTLGAMIYADRSAGMMFKQIANRHELSLSTVARYLDRYLESHPALPRPIGIGREHYTNALGAHAYANYMAGDTNEAIAQDLGVGKKTAREWRKRYANEHNLPAPVGTLQKAEQIEAAGQYVYRDLAGGSSIGDAAKKFTNGDVGQTYASALRYANKEGIDRQLIDAAWAKYLENKNAATSAAERQAAASRPAPQIELDPMTDDQYCEIVEKLDEGESSQQISKETGVPETSVSNVEHGHGYYSTSKRAYVEPGYDPENAQPPSKRPRSDDKTPPPGPPSGAGPSGVAPASGGSAVTGWGRAEMREFLSADDEISGNMDPRIRDAISEWLQGTGATPAGLQQEMIEQGYSDLTPDMVRDYINNARLSMRQMRAVEVWLGL